MRGEVALALVAAAEVGKGALPAFQWPNKTFLLWVSLKPHENTPLRGERKKESAISLARA